LKIEIPKIENDNIDSLMALVNRNSTGQPLKEKKDTETQSKNLQKLIPIYIHQLTMFLLKKKSFRRKGKANEKKF